MKWKKKGLIYNVDGKFSWNKTHAQVPIAYLQNNDTIRIYYATRDNNNQSHTSFIEVEKDNPSRILYIHDKPILKLGHAGTFDENGIMPTSIVKDNGKIFLYYIGWSKRVCVPYHNAIGLAISHDNGKSFKKLGDGPIVGTILNEPYFNGTCYVMKEDNLWRMWYLSCIKWERKENHIEPFYNLKYAESNNGIDWIRNGKIAIDLLPNEGGLASASVIKSKSIYEMWFSYRGAFNYRTNNKFSYKIGYASSLDGIEWKRDDHQAGISLSNAGWDSQMIAYPNIIAAKNKIILFYNGNAFGRSGFGYAILEN